MQTGFVKIWRKMKEWGWYKDSMTKAVFIHLLIDCNHAPFKFQGYAIPRGSVVVGRKSLARDLGLSEQNVRTTFYKLKSTNEITIKSTNKFSIVSIVNYCKYQDKLTNNLTNKSTNDQPTTNQQLTTIKEEKKIKNGKKVVLSDEDFLLALKADPTYFGVDFDREFRKMDDWLEKNPSRIKSQRFILNWMDRADRPVNTGKVFKKRDGPVLSVVTDA